MIATDGKLAPTTQRPAFPWAIQHTNTRNNHKTWKTDRPVPINYEIQMAWHHIIAWKYLRNGWSALVTSGRWDAIAAWINLWGLSYKTEDLIGNMKANNLGGNEQQDMFNKLCWAEFNLVEGPKESNRTDDPGSDALDPFEGAKMPANIRKRSQVLKTIYTTMKSWSVDTDTVSEKDEKKLVKDFKDLAQFARSPISRFDPAVWVLIDPGKIDKFGIAQRHPTWKKAP